jgi:hypothetical protein
MCWRYSRSLVADDAPASMTLINEFDFEIKHIKGKENRVANALI